MRPLALTLVAAATLGAANAAAQRSTPIHRGMVITSSMRVAPGTYRLGAPASLDSAVIVIRGDDIVVDFGGATLEGAPSEAPPDSGHGVAIRIDGGRNVTVRNARVRGYKVAIMALGTRGLSLIDDDLSYNWKPRLYSIVEHESLVDWLSYHHNEKDEWLRYGAAAYLSDVHGGEIRGVRTEQGMNGLMLVRSDSLKIWNNELSFNSGVGIGLYRSSYNTIMHNDVSYDVRGYSQGFYRRGQDSADLLIYEQSSHNVIAYNQMTHGGDGLFLWAGQSTMDTGEGGANDNLFYRNDFSFAPTNGMEATFSRNAFIENRIEGSDYGLWGGYSSESKVIGNTFTRNRTGIGIEHGQDNVIAGNRFDGDTVAIYVWGNPIEPSDWAYPKHRDTKSRSYAITDNAFIGNRVGIRVANTIDSRAIGNTFTRVDSAFVVKDTQSVMRRDDASHAATKESSPLTLPTPLKGARDFSRDPLGRRDRAAIIVDEWGPYDWRSPKLWPADSSRSSPMRLRVLGPAGSWRVAKQRGIATLSRSAGRVGDTITVTPVAGQDYDWALTLEYKGGQVVTRAGVRLPARTPVQFSYDRFEPRAAWTIGFFPWSDATDPQKQPAAFDSLLASTPAVTQQAPRLDYMWYSPTVKGVPQSKFGVRATTTVALPAGSYTLRAISDDGVRVWIDGRLAIDHWAAHESAVDEVPIAGGTHDIRVAYYQVDGWTELRLEIVR